MIKVQYYGPLRRLTGLPEEEMEAGKVTELLQEIEHRHGEQARCEAEASFILIKGKNIALMNGFNTSLQQDVIVKIIPLAGGG